MKKKLIYKWMLLIGYKPKKTQHKEMLFESGTLQISLYSTGYGYISDWREQGYCSISCKTLIETLKAAYHAIQNGYIDGKYEPLPF